jgi:apolipoprotein N-acyltransferase
LSLTPVDETRERASRAQAVLYELALLALAALLFALSFPSFLSRWGWFPLAYIALVPVFLVIHRAGWLGTALYGALYGYLAYALHNYWLGAFHPLTLAIVPPIYAFYLLVTFLALKAADTLLPRWGFLAQSALWVAYEFWKVQGFLGYSYGTLGYSQYLFQPLIRVAALTGVWGVSWLVVFPSAWLAHALREGRREPAARLRAGWPAAAAWAVLFAAALGYGFASRVDLSQARPWRVALVQQNIDPWRGGYAAYGRSLDILRRLSREAVKRDPEIVIWSETSFVPAIDWHTRYRTDREAYELVRQLREFLAGQGVPYVIGNDDGRLKRLESGEEVRVDYNATLLFRGGELLRAYRKLRLVPFTETFPYRRWLPGIYEWLRRADTHFWEPGEEHTVFEAGGVRFSTPICFEDTFPGLCREFVRRGAQVLVNMTNDSWSKSVACEMQHMAIALFRAVENRRTLVRATNGGITCIVDPNGRITALLPPFREDFLVAAAPVYDGAATLYTRLGDWFAWLALAAGLALPAAAGLRAASRRSRGPRRVDKRHGLAREWLKR